MSSHPKSCRPKPCRKHGGVALSWLMTGKHRKSSQGSSAAARAERLKAALRQNLKRRKAQARGRSREAAGATHDSAGFAADKPKG